MLLAADGKPNVKISLLVGMSRPTVNTWRGRYVERGLAGLDDELGPGRAQTVDPRRIVTETLRSPPKSLGVTHWSSLLLAERLCVDEKSEIQALNGTQKTLPMQPGHAEQRTHDDVRGHDHVVRRVGGRDGEGHRDLQGPGREGLARDQPPGPRPGQAQRSSRTSH